MSFIIFRASREILSLPVGALRDSSYSLGMTKRTGFLNFIKLVKESASIQSGKPSLVFAKCLSSLHDHPRRCAVRIQNLHGKTYHVVKAGQSLGEIKPFNDENPCVQ